MHWIAPTEKAADNATMENRLSDTAAQFRANSGLKSQEYSARVLLLLRLLSGQVELHTREVQS